MISNGALSGIQAAVEEINERSDLLSGYTLNYKHHSKVINYSCYPLCAYLSVMLYYRLGATKQLHSMPSSTRYFMMITQRLQ